MWARLAGVFGSWSLSTTITDRVALAASGAAAAPPVSSPATLSAVPARTAAASPDGDGDGDGTAASTNGASAEEDVVDAEVVDEGK